MYRIAVLTNSRAQEAFGQSRSCSSAPSIVYFPKWTVTTIRKAFFEAARCEPLTNAVIALPGWMD